MAFTFNGTTPTAINYNGTNLTVLKYGTTAVWGKPFSLSITQGANTTVTVSRTSSPNQHANTGALSSGAVVYYGDILTISASANSGYNLSTFTVNGTAWTSGNTITVTSAITVVTTAQSAASWKTVWTGSNTTVVTSSYSQLGGASDGEQNVSLSNFGTTGVDRKTRITGNVVCAFSNTSYGSKTTNFSEKEVSGYTSWFAYHSYQVGTATVRSDAGVSYNSSNRTLTFYSSTSVSGIKPPNIVHGKATFTITKIEQYY